MNQSEYLKKSIKDGYIEPDTAKNRISYKTREGIKSYPLNKPEEQVRAEFYSELIYKYKYEPKRIGLEVEVPRRKPSDWADIVVYEDDNGKKSYLIVECKRDGISEAEIKQAIEQAFGNANSLRGKYALVIAGSVRIAFDVAKYPPNERDKNIISDIPIRYGKVPKYTYKKGAPEIVFGVGDRDLKKPTRQELLNKFQQCHDIIWQGGRRNPAEAFDEMSKLMFCKIWDERWITKKNEYYKFQVGTHETKKEVAGRIKEIYDKAQELEPGVFVDLIKVGDPIIYSVVQMLQEISLAKADLDAKGEAFEHFLGKIFKGEMGQYFTPREVVRFMVSFLEPDEFDYVIDPACGSGGFLLEVLEQARTKLFCELEERDADRRWRDFALDQIWGIEINSQLSRVAMMNMILHEDGHTNIENGDALDDPQTWVKEGVRKHFGNKFTLLLTNPPFGAVIKWEENQYLERYNMGKGRKRQKAEILFIERGLELLKAGGRLGIVLPDGILTNATLQDVRDFIMDKSQILGIVSLPQGAFTYYGSGVQASLVFLKKKKEGERLPENYPIFMAEAKHIGYDTAGRPDKNEFSEILKAWKVFKGRYLNDALAPKAGYKNENSSL
jgi:type I restriction enzyme M protein